MTMLPHDRARSRSLRRRSSDIEAPDGFWNVGIA